MGLRQALNERPILGWAVAAAVAVVALAMFIRNLGGGETQELSQEVTLRCSETGKEIKMPRGAVEKQLMMRPYPVNPDEGLPNPDTGKLTMFPVDDWKNMVSGVNASRKPLAEKGGGAPAPPRPPSAPSAPRPGGN
jgi:hypothetical protein